MEDCSYNARPTFSRNNSGNKERGKCLCVARCLANTPFFWGSDSLSCVDSGESPYSGRTPGLDRKAKLAIISAKPERLSGESLQGVLESRSGLIMGDFVDQRFPFNRSCVARSCRLDPRSGEVICCLAEIMGKSRDSGLRLGLDARVDSGISSVHPERLEGNLGTPPIFKIRADNGRYRGQYPIEYALVLNRQRP